MNDTDGFYLDRPSQAKLATLLYPGPNDPPEAHDSGIPSLLEDLAVTLTRQDRITTGSLRVSNGSDEQPLPISESAMEAEDLLHNTLVGWVRHVCEQRMLTCPVGDTLTLARWLAKPRHIIALGLTEGAEESLSEIQYAVRKARAAVDRPREKARAEPNGADLEEADAMVLNASAAARLAKSIGYPDLTIRRVKYLRESERITPVQTAGRNLLFLFGDVRKAHKILREQEQEEQQAIA